MTAAVDLGIFSIPYLITIVYIATFVVEVTNLPFSMLPYLIGVYPLVGIARLELTTSTSQMSPSAKLTYIPIITT